MIPFLNYTYCFLYRIILANAYVICVQINIMYIIIKALESLLDYSDTPVKILGQIIYWFEISKIINQIIKKPLNTCM